MVITEKENIASVGVINEFLLELARGLYPYNESRDPFSDYTGEILDDELVYIKGPTKSDFTYMYVFTYKPLNFTVTWNGQIGRNTKMNKELNLKEFKSMLAACYEDYIPSKRYKQGMVLRASQNLPGGILSGFTYTVGKVNETEREVELYDGRSNLGEYCFEVMDKCFVSLGE